MSQMASTMGAPAIKMMIISIDDFLPVRRLG
jgi:hypothetical protein